MDKHCTAQSQEYTMYSVSFMYTCHMYNMGYTCTCTVHVCSVFLLCYMYCMFFVRYYTCTCNYYTIVHVINTCTCTCMYIVHGLVLP